MFYLWEGISECCYYVRVLFSTFQMFLLSLLCFMYIGTIIVTTKETTMKLTWQPRLYPLLLESTPETTYVLEREWLLGLIFDKSQE